MGEASKKRKMLVDNDFDRSPSPDHKRWKFPKGKKAKRSGEDDSAELDRDDIEGFIGRMNPKLAAKERAKRRGVLREEEVLGTNFDVRSAEVHYEDNVSFEDDGIRIEPFNLKEEREEGYFDANGNFIEYARKKEIKDAWLDNVEVDTRVAVKFEKKVEEVVYEDLSPDDIGKIKRSIANALEPGETIIQALKRLKGNSDERGKMSDVTKSIFDQLTEDAMKLMENGDYNVYHEKRETFEREADGYERLTRTKGDTSVSGGISDFWHGDSSLDKITERVGEPSIWDVESGSSANVTAPLASSVDNNDSFDMFGEDENEEQNQQFVCSTAGSNSTIQQSDPSTSNDLNSTKFLHSGESANGEGSDYVYDESSGYYYSSSSGYFYDPASGMYASATTGTWYTFDQQSGSYIAVENLQPQEIPDSCVQMPRSPH